jgi:hypothetical protein
MDDNIRPSYRHSSNSYDLSDLPNRYERRARIQLPTNQAVVAGTESATDYSPKLLSPAAQSLRNSQDFGDTRSTLLQSPTSPVSPAVRRKPVHSPREESNEVFSRPNLVSISSSQSAVYQESAYAGTSYDDKARLLGSAAGESEPYQRSQVQDEPPGPPRNNTAPQFLRWQNPIWLMLLFYALGIVAAISHHAFYKSLDGKEASNQLIMLRYGGIFAYFLKANFVAAVLLAYRQQIWATCRRKELPIRTIDCLFAAADDLSAMFNLEFIRAAKSAIALACLIW